MATKKTTKKKTAKSSTTKTPSEAAIERGIERVIEKKIKGFVSSCAKEEAKCKCKTHATGGCIYFLGFVGAAVHYISTATGFWNGVLGVLKALVWPAMLVFKLLGL